MKFLKYSPVFFFSESEKKIIEESIGEAEKHTSGEIRVHLEGRVRGDILVHARKVFERIGMTKTKDRNGVLLFLSVRDRQVAILGDRGINEKVPPKFWEQEIALIQESFSRGEFAEGVSKAVLQVGYKLKEYFPRDRTDANELPDKISF